MAAKRLRVIQRGLETTYGTAVAATQRVLAKNFAPVFDPGVVTPEQDAGVLGTYHPGVQTQNDANLTWEDDFTPEQFLDLVYMGVKGPITPSTTTGVSTWTALPAMTGADSFKSLTYQRRLSDGVTNIDRQYPGTLASEIMVSAGVGAENVQMRGSLFSTGEDSSGFTFTAAQALPALTKYTLCPSNLCKIWIDASWAGLGGTQITGKNFQFSWTLATGLSRARYHDGSLKSSGFNRNAPKITLQLTMDVGTTSEALRAAVLSRAINFIRIGIYGANISGGTPATPAQCLLDGAYRINAFPDEGDRDGTDTIQITAESVYDPTSANQLAVTLKSGLAAFP